MVVGGGAMNVFAGGGGGAGPGAEAPARDDVGALLELTPHKIAVCHLVQVLAPPAPFQSVAHHNRLGLFLFSLTRAAAVVNSLFTTCYKYNMQAENAAVLLLLAEIHKKSDNAVLGLSYALASQSFCKSFNLDLLEASATLTLAELWLALGSSHVKRALGLVYQSPPMILVHGSLELRARSQIVLAKCHLTDPEFSVFEDARAVLNPLNQAAEDVQVLEYHEMAAEVYYLKAMTYNHLGKEGKREEAAACFKEHVTALENLCDKEDSLAY
ncbi:anaphase-promoting complex subunit 5-like [Triticum aestivum]|uniref:anaphase-promoting complex subunit 5-like n=1 Tax=Triticum aestivum TaxID=4565 RepID=UPI001D01B134|nr:anaphase-promoting complex subunit 5-like [Triticum aestivum]